MSESLAGGGLAALTAGLGAVAGAFGLWCANRRLGKAAIQIGFKNGFPKLTYDLQAKRTALRRELAKARAEGLDERARLQSPADISVRGLAAARTGEPSGV